jgi:hypothetical protein
MSEASQTTVASGTKSRNGSVSYSAFPSPSHHDAQQNNEAPAQAEQFSTIKESTGMIVEGAKEQPSLNGVVDLSNTVDTDVTTKTSPGTDLAPIPALSSLHPQSNISHSLSTTSRASRRLSNYSVPKLSPLRVHPPEIKEPPSSPLEDWPLPPTFPSPNSSFSKPTANMLQ